ncbi:MAG: sigma-54-dependent transcriptional regulator [Terriglobia bacterium]
MANRSLDTPNVTLLAVDDDPLTLNFLRAALASDDVEILTSSDPEEGLNLVFRQRPQIVLLDLMMPKLGGMEMLEKILAADPSINVLLLTGDYSTDSAVQAILKGACDYLTKPISVDKLRERVGRLIDECQQRQRLAQLELELLKTAQFEGIVGASPLMLELFARIRRVAPHFRTVLVTGATGTGKELVARALHSLSPVSSGPFAVLNCAAVVETLFESELFGYVKGAFTGATQDKLGVFEYANGGVLLLDEIGDMPLATQTKLLRVIQNQEIQRVGSPVTRPVDVRVIAATNRDLKKLVLEKAFREDLYFRLSMVEVRLPSLLERKEDLPLLEEFFLERFAAQYNKPVAKLSRRAHGVLARYPWPGNVRELENVIGHACMMAESNLIDIKDLPEHFQAVVPRSAFPDDDLISLEEAERRHALRVLERVNGNKAKAAEILGVSRSTLYRLISESEPASEENS